MASPAVVGMLYLTVRICKYADISALSGSVWKANFRGLYGAVLRYTVTALHRTPSSNTPRQCDLRDHLTMRRNCFMASVSLCLKSMLIQLHLSLATAD